MPRRPPAAARELRLTARARARHGLASALFSLRGDLLTSDLPTIRRVARELDLDAGDLYALGCIHEIQHALVAAHERSASRPILPRALASLAAGPPGRAATERVLERYLARFPSPAVAAGRRSPSDDLRGRTGGRSNRALTLEELLLTALANANPAAASLRSLFDDRPLARDPAYRRVVERLPGLLPATPGGPGSRPDPDAPGTETHDADAPGPDLVTLLRQPAGAEPASLAGQLRWMRRHWPDLVAPYLDHLLLALDLLAEEARARELAAAARGPFGGGSGADVPDLASLADEPERFSPDQAWMPSLVLLAKSTYVWLDQLERAYGRPIRTLDAVPDEELAELARRGFSGLWLIGLWQRSPASAEIKRRMGQPDAAASAYSLWDYRIAPDLGGEAALVELRARAWRQGIRLASDMVPNHMGLDSTWVVEHPEWFIGLDAPPFPGYRFGGPDLSSDGRVEIRIEDGYWDHSDAAVVFERRERASGATRYIYHGNDGTSMPWNDTAQLDYLQLAVREQVIRTIIEVARRFPIIRFDAAMTLARRHVERLWYPEPGQGGAIPSRAEHALPRSDFLAAMPHEFWREVVDRVAAEVPDTLLLAEAFWLMEGTFVRSLGMHRVYNSAFMHMLRDERNAEYRALVAETLAFDPRILGRYVDFMSNPDERTAIEQFGTGEKYAGVCTLLATLPGLPMFGHGQVEGFSEQYGMEFTRARREETPDPDLRALHEWRIFPLLHRRALFAGAEDFRLYDVLGDDGRVLEDIFAYSNRRAGERALVVYHNRFAEAHGWADRSAPFVAPRQGEQGAPRTERLAEALGLGVEPGLFYAARDAVSHEERLVSGAELGARGLRVDLGAYGCQVLLDWRELRDPQGDWARLHERLGDGLVADLEAALAELLAEPARTAYAELVTPDRARDLQAILGRAPGARSAASFLADLGAAIVAAAPTSSAAPTAFDRLAAQLVRPPIRRAVAAELGHDPAAWAGLLLLLVDAGLGRDDRRPPATPGAQASPGAQDTPGPEATPGAEATRAQRDRLRPVAIRLLEDLGASAAAAGEILGALEVSATLPLDGAPASWLDVDAARTFLQLHSDAEGQAWITQERYEALVRWWSVRARLDGHRPRPSARDLRRLGARASWSADDLMLASSTIHRPDGRMR
ncbi:MAG TPA: alpha-amylase family glycosyl hydrolase [Candidatus Limnocylindrales bacterium]|nr:alpha-amylase family glycosyl hydrolase [Candidatus Limnocylindrales bacterium]